MLVYEVSERLHLYLLPLPRGGITTPLKEKPLEMKEGRNHILAFCIKWHSVVYLLCLVCHD